MTHVILRSCLGALIGLWALNASAATAAGSVVTVKGTVSVQSADGAANFLGKGTDIFEGDTVISAKKSFAVIKFTDDSKVVIRANTVFKVEGYSFGEGDDNTSFNLLKGGIRAVTGAIAKSNPDNYKLETPVASLGVRGTKFDAQYCAKGDNDCAEQEQELGKTARSAAPAQGECQVTLEFTGTPPGGYFYVREGKIFLSRDGEILELGVGEAAFADRSSFGCLPSIPNFLDNPTLPFTDTEDFRGFGTLQCGI